MRSNPTLESAKVCLECPGCRQIIQVPQQEAKLLSLGARALIDCPECKTRFTGEPKQIWKLNGGKPEPVISAH